MKVLRSGLGLHYRQYSSICILSFYWVFYHIYFQILVCGHGNLSSIYSFQVRKSFVGLNLQLRQIRKKNNFIFVLNSVADPDNFPVFKISDPDPDPA